MKVVISLAFLVLLVKNSSCLTIKHTNCEDPSAPDNGEVIYNSTEIGAILTYKCKRGFNLKSSGPRECTSEGKWSGEDPLCERVTCKTPKNPNNGRAIYSDITFGSILKYECNEGFLPRYKQSRVCRVTGTWGEKKEVCEAAACKVPIDPANGKAIYTSLDVGSELKYQCDEDFILSSDEVRKCTKNGTWSGEDPLCKEMMCNDPEKPKGGKFRILEGEARIGSTVVFSCNTGSTLVGPESAKCLETTEWSKEIPKCIKNCGPPPSIDKAEISNKVEEPYSLNTTVSYKCDFGYVQHGENGVAVCIIDEETKDSVWTSPVITCLPRSCGDPGDVDHAQRKGSDFTFPNDVEYFCNEGYRLSGRPKRYCLPGGTWSDRLPVCRLILCDFPKEPTNGKVSYNSLEFGSMLHYECNEGFALKNHVERRCTTNGSWSGEEPICEEAECQYPEVQDVNILLTGGKITSGRIAIFSCSPGKTLVGSKILKCRDTGEWSSEIPKCFDTCSVTAVQKGNIGESVKRGRFVSFQKISVGTKIDHGKQLKVKCNSGYETGNQSAVEEEITCENGKWSPEPICIPAQCRSRPPTIPNGAVEKYENLHDSIASYKCNEFYKLVNKGLIVCKYGAWQGKVPVCSDTRCYIRTLKYISGLLLNDTEYLASGESFTPACTDAYEMTNTSDEQIYCGEGQWSGNLAPCIEKPVCDDLEVPVGANIKIIGRKGKVGSSVVFTCKRGRKLVGNTTSKCTETGKWTSAPPECLRTCKVASVRNGVFGNFAKRGRFVKFQKVTIGKEIEVGKNLKLKCNRGYEPENESNAETEITCEDGRWSPEPICMPAHCRYPPPSLANGVIERHEEDHDSLAFYKCNDFYKLVNKGSIMCKFGIWKGQLPICNDTRCYMETLKHIPGLILYDTEYLVNGESFTPACTEAYEMVNTSDAQIYCREGEWSSNPCIERKVCDDLEVSVGANIETIGGRGTVGSSVVFTCNPGRKLVGNSTSKCMETGEWTSQPPECLKTCKVPVVSHGSVRALKRNDSFIYFHEVPEGATVDSGKELIFKCNQKYELANEGKSRLKVVCDNGELSTDVNCVPAKCRYAPPTVQNGYIEEFDDTHNGSVVYNCNNFFTLASNGSVACSFGSWIGDLPMCKDTRCYAKDLSDTPGLLIDEKGIFLNDESFHPKCRDGYEIAKGRDIMIYCTEGDWTGNLPPCEEVRCTDPPPRPKNGRATHYNGNNGTSVIYVCDDGYSLEENTKVQCLDRNWIGIPPICSDTRCYMRSLSKYSGLVLDQENILLNGQSFKPECDEGTSISESSDVKIYCRKGEWTGNLPPCKEANCLDPPPEPENGKVIQFTGLHGTTVTYECNDYYNLETANSMKCTKGVWIGETPICKDTRCYLKDLPNTEGIQLDDVSLTLPNKIAEIHCEDGYTLTFKPPTCSRGTWNTTTKYSPCQPRYCQVQKIEQGIIKSMKNDITDDTDYLNHDEDFMMTTISQQDEDFIDAEIDSWIRNGEKKYVYCEPPYSFAGQESYGYIEILCNKGNWKPVPECLLTQSHDLTENVTSSLDEEPNAIDSTTTTLGEPKGLKATISPEEVTSTTAYTSSDCLCTYTSTDTSLQVHFGKQLLWQNSKIPDGLSIIFHCKNIGSDRLIGPREIRCSGCEWESASPVCRGPKDDGDVAISVTARPENDTSIAPGGILVVAEGTQLNISCYALNSEEIPSWNRPEQNQHLETEPEYDENGKLLRTSTSNTYFISRAMSSDSGKYECTVESGKSHHVEIEVRAFLCPEIQKDESLVIHYEGNREMNSKAHFWCSQLRTKLFGSETVTCLPTGQWSDGLPTCKDILCPEIAEDDSMFITYDDRRRVHSKARFWCRDRESEIVGEAAVTCLPTGEWSADLPKCEYVLCPEIAGDDSMFITYDGRRHVHSKAYFWCNDPESKIVGEAAVTCLSTGEWSAALPKCGHLFCPEISVDETVKVIYNAAREIYSTASFLCSDYKSNITGPRSVSCLPNGQWSHNPPTCKVVCLPGCHEEHGKCKQPDECICKPGWKGRFCDECIANPGCAHGTCTEPWQCNCNEGWGGLFCDRAVCLPGCHEEHGTCKQPNECICKPGWEGRFCEECIRYPGCVHGTCNEELECNCDEGWVGIFCDQNFNYCNNYRPCKNGGTCTNTDRGSYTCDCADEYMGTKCDILRNPCQMNPCLNGATCIPTEGNYTCQCDLGYLGPHCETATTACRDNPCENGGTCVHDQEGFFCECPPTFHGRHCEELVNGCESGLCVNDSYCPEIQADDSVKVKYNADRQIYSTASFLCSNPEYEMNGPLFVSCLPGGEWSANPPICIGLHCPEIETNDSVQVIYSENRKIQSTANFYCSNVYSKINGPAVVSCLPNGKWSDRPPTCIIVYCPEIETDDSVVVTYIALRLIYSSASFHCSTPDSEINGPLTISCLPNGEWSENPPTCNDSSCPAILTDDLLNVTYFPSREISGTAAFYCSGSNMELIGPAAIICQESGKWSEAPPICRYSSCPEILTDDLLAVTYFPSREISGTAAFHCSGSNMELIGPAAIICLESGEWSEAFPICRYIECPEIPQVPGLEIKYHPNRQINSNASFRCKAPLKMIGRKTITCKSSGKWSGETPSCNKPSEVCSIKTLVRHLPSNVVLVDKKQESDILPLESVVHLRCHLPGRDSMGSAIGTCKPNGRWNVEECVVGCVPFKPPSNSSLIVNEIKHFYLLGSAVTFSCPPGQKLTPELVRVMCLNGGWSNTKLPDCVVIAKREVPDITSSHQQLSP